MSVEASGSTAVSTPDPIVAQRGQEYLVSIIDEHNAKGEKIISEADKKSFIAAYRVASDEEKEACLSFSPEDFLLFIELLRDSIVIANEAAEFLHMTRQVVRQACEAQGMPESEIVKRLRLDQDVPDDRRLTLDLS